MDVCWAAGPGVAAEIHVAESGDAWGREACDGVAHVGVEQVVVVPRGLMRVDEDGDVAEDVVVVDDVGEVRHDFVAFVLGHRVLGAGVVDGVRDSFEGWIIAEFVLDPIDGFLARAGDDERAGEVLRWVVRRWCRDCGRNRRW